MKTESKKGKVILFVENQQVVSMQVEKHFCNYQGDQFYYGQTDLGWQYVSAERELLELETK